VKNLNEFFTVTVSRDQLSAEIDFIGKDSEELKELNLTREKIKQFLKDKNVTFGIIENNVTKIIETKRPHIFPIIIAKGIDREDGMDGKIEYMLDLNPEVDRSENWDFRDVMKIPTVQEGEKLAVITPPTKGKNGTNVRGKPVLAKPGKPYRMRAGKNVTFNKDENTFYANETGQIHVGYNVIHVHTVHEVVGDVSMKTGNIDFVGTVIVRGNVPTGFTIKAQGDVKIFGIVEAATVIANGSVYISEGIAGLKTGTIEAGDSVHIGYVNQANIRAGNSIIVENSIFHSECVAANDIICQRGNIVGGSSSAGKVISVKDLGNRMHTHTYISFGYDQKVFKELNALEAEKKSLEENVKKIKLLQSKLEKSEQKDDGKTRITLLRLRNSYNKTNEKINEIDEQISRTNAKLGDIDRSSLSVKGTMYPNVIVSFGKYQRTINREHDHVKVRMEDNEIVIGPY